LNLVLDWLKQKVHYACMNRLSIADRARILGCLVEGNSLRATARMVDVSLNTVLKFVRDLGAACSIYQNDVLRNLNCRRVQCDEIWSFVGAKAKNVKRGANGVGDVYTWI